MNELLMLPQIKSLVFVLKSSTEYNVDFIFQKKAVELSFCSRLKRYVLMVSTLAFAFKIIRPIIFSAVKKVNFLLSRKFSLIKELVQSQGNFP